MWVKTKVKNKKKIKGWNALNTNVANMPEDEISEPETIEHLFWTASLCFTL